jgi:hypothetical protein
VNRPSGAYTGILGRSFEEEEEEEEAHVVARGGD